MLNIECNRCNKELNLEKATEYLHSILWTWHIGSCEEKVEILQALKVVISNEFKINENQIYYNITDLSRVDAYATIECNRGDNIYRVRIDKDFFETSTNIYFTQMILHEFGHLKQYLNAKRGKKSPDSVSVSSKIYHESKWQQLGGMFKYLANGNEFNAEKFATSKILKWIKEESKNKPPNSALLKNGKEIKLAHRLNRESYILNKGLLGIWRLTNRVFRIKESENARNFKNYIDVEERIWKTNVVFPVSQTEKDLNLAKRLVNHHLKTKDETIKGLGFNKKFVIATDYCNKLRLIYARELDVSVEELGFMFIGGGGEVEGTYMKDYNPSSRMLFFVTYPEERLKKIKSIGEFLNEVIPFFDDAKEKYFNRIECPEQFE